MSGPASTLPNEALETLQAFAPDYALACGFIPRDKRDAITTLYAFYAELQSVKWRAREPLMGEVRLQWWREALLGERPLREVEAHPLAQHLLNMLARFHLPVSGLVDLVDCMMDDLYDDPPEDMTALELYCGQTCSVLLRYASLMLADGQDAGPADIAGPAGVAVALTQIVQDIPLNMRGGRVMVPAAFLQQVGIEQNQIHSITDPALMRLVVLPLLDLAEKRYDEFKAARYALPAKIRPAFALTGLVAPRLAILRKAVHKASYKHDEPFEALGPLSKTIRLWMAAVWGRV